MERVEAREVALPETVDAVADRAERHGDQVRRGDAFAQRGREVPRRRCGKAVHNQVTVSVAATTSGLAAPGGDGGLDGVLFELAGDERCAAGPSLPVPAHLDLGGAV